MRCFRVSTSKCYTLIILFSCLVLPVITGTDQAKSLATGNNSAFKGRAISQIESEMASSTKKSTSIHVRDKILAQLDSTEYFRKLRERAGAKEISRAESTFNITGMYKGNWMPEDGSYDVLSKLFVFKKTAGNVIFQIKSDYLSDNKTQFLKGYMRLRDGYYSLDGSQSYKLYGIYYPESGDGYLDAHPVDVFKGMFFNATMIPDRLVEWVGKIGEWKGKDEWVGSLKKLRAEIGQFIDDDIVQSELSIKEHSANYPSSGSLLDCDLQVYAYFGNGLMEDGSIEIEGKDSVWGKLIYGFVAGNGNDQSSSRSDSCSNLNLGIFANGLILEDYYTKVKMYTFMVVAICVVQIRLLLRQISYTSNQNRAARVSLITIGQQAILDSYISLVHLYAAIVFETVFHTLLTAAFLKFVLFSGIEMQYILLIWRAKNPNSGNGGWEHVRTQLTLLYSRLYYILIMGVCLMFRFRESLTVVLLIAYSFWIPQIVANAYNETRNALDHIYVYGMSASRLLLPFYFYGCPKNITVPPDHHFLVCLTTWVAFQVLVLVLQDRWGPRFFVPARFLPEKYNYHRTIHFPQFAERDPETGSEVLDCVICMNPINKQLADYMVTPCNHLFHPACLTQWIDVKMECPTCRRELPPP